MLARFTGFVIALAVMIPLGAEAQNVTIEGGAAGFGVSQRTSFGNVTAAVEGGYVGVSVAIPGATWLQPYGAGNGFRVLGGLGQAGVNFRLGPEQWIARPVARAGAAFGESGAVTGGFGVYIGRRGGGLFTADVGSVDGVVFSIVHFGGYFRF